MSKKRAALYFLALSFASCALLRPGEKAISNSSGSHPLEVNQRDFQDSEGIRARVKAELTNGSKIKVFNLSMRLKPREGILLSAPLGAAKALLTPGEVAFYNKLDRTYYQGSVSIIETIIPAQLNYEHIERLFLGQLLFLESIGELNEANRNIVDVLINKSTASRVFSGNVTKPAEGYYRVELSSDMLKINCQEFQMEGFDPLKITYQYKNKDAYTPQRIQLASGSRTLNLDLEGVQLDKKLTLPFQIPSGFTLIK